MSTKPKPRKGKGTSDYNTPLTDQKKALIWVLTEEGRSSRNVAAEVGCGQATVARELASDPVRLESLRARLRESRAEAYKAIETRATDLALVGLQRIEEILTGKGRARLTKREELVLSMIPRCVGVVRQTAEGATRMHQLLSGGATDRIEQVTTTKEAEADQLIQMAIDAEKVQELPPMLQAAARKIIERGGRGGPQPDPAKRD